MGQLQTDADQLIAALKRLKKEEAQRKKLSDKYAGMTYENSTDRARGGLREKLNWQSMEVEKKRLDIARLFKGCAFDIEISKRVFKPSGFHEYEY